MNGKTRGLLIGGVIIAVGLLALVTNLGIISFGTELFWAVIFGGAGFALWSVYRRDSNQWWALIPAGILWVIAATIILTAIPRVSGDVVGVVLLWGIGISFIAVYAHQNRHWWSVILGGIFLTLGWVAFVGETRWLNDNYQVFIFFFGIGLTFGFLYLIKDEENKLRWAQYPAIVLLLLSFFLLLVSEDSLLAEISLPAALIVLGAILVVKSLVGKTASGEAPTSE
jgi:hypothetical protein